MSILYTHCAQCSTMGLTRVTLQYKILHLWERQHKEKIRECQSCHSKWYCCNTVLLLWCTLKIPQQRYWLCLIFLCVSAHLIHGLLFWQCGQTCLALQASLWIVRLSDLFCAGFLRGRKKRKRENVEGKEVCFCLCVCHQIIKKCQVMSQEAWCECDGALLCLSPFPWFSFHRWTSTLVPALIHHHASHLTCPRCTPTDIHAWTQHTYERAVSPDARDLNEKATTTKKVLFKKEHVSLFIHSWNEEKEAMTHTCTYTHCDESDIYQPGFKSSQIVLHFISALPLHFTSIPLDTHCSPPIYRSFHVTDCCW